MNQLMAKRLRGYHRHFRGRFLLLSDGVLSDQEFVLWDLAMTVLADWDKNHETTYGSFSLTDGQIADFLGCSASKVNRKTQRLLELGLWQKKGDRVFMAGYEIFENLTQITRERKIVSLHDFIPKLHKSNAKKHNGFAKQHIVISKANDMVPDQSYAKLQNNSPKSLVSFKGEFNGHRKEEEYQQMYKQDPNGPSIEEMKFMDESIWESMGVGPHGERKYE